VLVGRALLLVGAKNSDGRGRRPILLGIMEFPCNRTNEEKSRSRRDGVKKGGVGPPKVRLFLG
jgi:hypothetical protein